MSASNAVELEYPSLLPQANFKVSSLANKENAQES